MVPVKIGIYRTASAILKNQKKGLQMLQFTLVYDYYLHSDIAKCKSSKYKAAFLEVNNEMSGFHMTVFISQFKMRLWFAS